MTQSSQTTTSQNTTAPWQQAMPEVTGLLGQLGNLIPGSGTNGAEQNAINQLTAAGQAGNPYAAATQSTISGMLNGGGATGQVPQLQSNLTNFQAGMAPYTAADYSTLNSPAVQNALQQIGTDTTNQINSQFAAAGRSGSGMNAQTLGRGIAQAEAPLILNQANADTATRENALNSLYGAGNSTAGLISGLNQTGIANQQAGLGAVAPALSNSIWGPELALAAQQSGQSLPAQNLGLLANIGIPLAELGRTTNGTSTTDSNPSFLSSVEGLGSMFGPFGGGTNLIKTASGIGSGVLGALGGLFAGL
ncbi:MAG TPA: tail fiber domain-containing protein [Pseudolabrys sp.]|nr:tail fiber domain-containing protein [Pseudolabrys sp.]